MARAGKIKEGSIPRTHLVSLVASGEKFMCAEDQNLLQGMLDCQAGRRMVRAIPVGCRGGGCGICQIRVTAGKYETGKMSTKHITREDRARGLALACRVFPRSELQVELSSASTQGYSAELSVE